MSISPASNEPEFQPSIRAGRRAVDPTPELRHFDAVTGLALRSLFEERLQQQWESCQTEHRPLGLLLIDFDGLGAYRTSNGLLSVDQMLARCAGILATSCRRRADLPARVRAGEFAVLLSDVNLNGATRLAEQIRAGIESLRIPRGEDAAAGHVTVSVGAVCFVPPTTHFPHALVIACDHALKDAKDEGGNCIAVRRKI